MLSAELGTVQVLDASPSVVATLRDAHERLVELLHMATSLLGEFSLADSLATEGAAIPLVNGDSAAISRRAGNSVEQPARSAAILPLARSPPNLKARRRRRGTARLSNVGLEGTSTWRGGDR
ncbi:unnamed protein product [Lampetra fluviatilis]